jgi:hypothetical protein
MTNFMKRTKILANSFKKGTKDEGIVKDGQADKDPVEDRGHPFAQKYWNGNEVSHKSKDPNEKLLMEKMKYFLLIL